MLLQTATAEVVLPNNDSRPHLRLVSDSCSKRSYVNQGIKHKLELSVLVKDSLLIKAFGESDARNCSSGYQTVCDATVYNQAYAVPVICGPPDPTIHPANSVTPP